MNRFRYGCRRSSWVSKEVCACVPLGGELFLFRDIVVTTRLAVQ